MLRVAVVVAAAAAVAAAAGSRPCFLTTWRRMARNKMEPREEANTKYGYKIGTITIPIPKTF